MTTLIVKNSKLKGSIDLPTSKSHSIRAIVFATFAQGKSKLHKLLNSPDIDAALKAAHSVGAKVTYADGFHEIEGTSGKFHPPQGEIDAGNSGQVLRFFGALAALCDQEVVITGDESVQKSRPVKPLIKALKGLGVQAKSLLDNDHAPIAIRGPAHAGETHMDGEDSQPVSGILMLAPYLEGTTHLIVKNAGEKTWIDLTLDWFKRLKIPCENKDYAEYIVKGKCQVKHFEYTVPGDFSSAAFPAAAAFATKSKVTLRNVDMSDIQGDKKFFEVLKMMGGHLEYNKEKKELFVDGTSKLVGQELDINDYIDAITILAVIGCLASGTTHVKNAEIARQKESDRIECICKELQKMGADIKETRDGFIVQHSKLMDATVESHRDHRIAMSLAVAALAAEGTTIIQNTECIKKSYPNFVEQMQSLGAQITQE